MSGTASAPSPHAAAPSAPLMEVPAHIQLVQMATAYWVSRLLYVAAKLSLADHLAAGDGPQSADALAAKTGMHPQALYRVMRTLASLGLFAETGEKQFALTPLGEAMKTGAPGSARATVLTLAGDWCWRGFEQLPYSVETGKSGCERAMGEPIFDWLGKHPEDAALFSETMIGFHGMEPAAVAAAYDFSGLDTIVDVGGASGDLLTTVLAKHPDSRGVLFDLAQGLGNAPALIASRGLSDRVSLQSGSFFDAVPAGGDAYLLSHVIHDWTDEQCQTILGNCRRAMKPEGRLLIIEMVLPEDNAPHLGKLLDIMMLVGPGGQERTEPEYRALLAKAGFKLTRVVPTSSAVSIVEAVRSSND